ncbi:hypothetical protein MLD38_027274 [Melastoma candidum]|uniref:Uncharacterized protein n=1 Tax=Melastoma candidum TaxID=119954 RepID=A0ACB9P2X0_9MYRT|nr:hypothetical protein MLD38_027274 [Melastoma candidum]
MDLNPMDSNGHGDDRDGDDDGGGGGICSVVDEEVDDDVDGDETKALLPAGEKGMSRSCDKGTRKVQWNDSIGNDLAEVLEFMPSEPSEHEEDDSNSCPYEARDSEAKTLDSSMVTFPYSMDDKGQELVRMALGSRAGVAADNDICSRLCEVCCFTSL